MFFVRQVKLGCLAVVLSSFMASQTSAEQVSAVSAGASQQRDVVLTEGAFVRHDPLPVWAQPLAGIPASESHKESRVVRLGETQFYAGAKPSFLVNYALQANDSSALGSLGQLSLGFDPAYQKLHLHRLMIVRGSESIDITDKASIRFLQREAGLEEGMYTGKVSVVMLIEDVRVGDTVQMVYSIDGQNPVFAGVYAEDIVWDSTIPVDLERVWFISPLGKKIQWQQLGDYIERPLKPMVLEENGLRKLKFEESHLTGIDPEPYTPSNYLPYRYLQFSEYADWNAVARWADTLFPPVTLLSPEMAAVVEKLRTLPTQEEQAAAALQWVQDNVRYFSVSLGESSHMPHAPSEVVQKRYGDCKDKTYLLVTLLRALNIDARPVLVNLWSPEYPKRLLPTATAFDHVIVQASINSRIYYLDGTRIEQHSPLTAISPVMPGASALVVDSATKNLTSLPSPKAGEMVADALEERFTVTRLGGDGQLVVKQTLRGAEAEVMRLGFSHTSNDKLKKGLQTPYEKQFPGIEMVGDPEIEDNLQDNSFSYSVKFNIPHIATEKDGAWFIRYHPGSLFDAWNVPRAVKRNFPVVQPHPAYAYQYRVSVQWPDNVSAMEDPATKHIKNDFFSVEAFNSFRGNYFVVDVRLAMNRQRIEPGELPQFVKELKNLDNVVPDVAWVSKGNIKTSGFLSIKSKTLMQRYHEQKLDEIAKISKVISANALQGDDRAAALCARASAYDDLAQHDEGMMDAEAAVKVAPSLGGAYLCRGDQYLAVGKYAKAIEDYSRALSLGGDAGAIYMGRGRAKAYLGHLGEARADFTKGRENGEDEILFPALWESWISLRMSQPLARAVSELAAKSPSGDWPRPALAMLAGILTPEQMFAEVSRKTGDDQALAMVEAQFYYGEYLLSQSRKTEAKAAFEKVRDSGVTFYIEYSGAIHELKLLEADVRP